MLGTLINAARRNPMTILVVIAAVVGAVLVGLWLHRKMEKFSDDNKCRKDGNLPLKCPQDNLYKSGFNCLHYDGARCCKQNWFGDGTSSNPGFCKAMDMRNITTDWNIPRFWTSDDYTGTMITSRNAYGGSITGGWKNLDAVGWKDRIESIKVPRGYTVEVASKDNGGGKQLTFGPGTSVSLKNCKYETGDSSSVCGGGFECTDSTNFDCWRDSVNSIRVTTA